MKASRSWQKPVRVMHLALVSLSIQDDLIMGPMRLLVPP